MKRLLSVLARVEESILALLLLTMIVLAFTQIVLRNFFDGGINWGDDAVRTLVLWVAMFGSMVAAGRGQHIRVDALVRYFPPLLRATIDRLVDLLTAGLCGAMAWFGYRFAALEYADALTAFASVPSWAVVAVIPVAFGFIAFRYALHALVGRPALVTEVRASDAPTERPDDATP